MVYKCELIMIGGSTVKSTIDFKSEKELTRFFGRRKMCNINGSPNLIVDLKNMASMSYEEVEE